MAKKNGQMPWSNNGQRLSDALRTEQRSAWGRVGGVNTSGRKSGQKRTKSGEVVKKWSNTIVEPKGWRGVGVFNNPDSGQTLVKRWLNSGQTLVKLWPNSGQTLGRIGGGGGLGVGSGEQGRG